MATPIASQVRASNRAVLFQGIAGTAIPAGCPVYQDGTTLRYLKAGALLSNAVQGIAQGNAANGQYFVGVKSDPNFTHGDTIGPGQTIIVSSIPGDLTPADNGNDGAPTTNWYVTVLGVATSTTTMNLSLVSSGNATYAP